MADKEEMTVDEMHTPRLALECAIAGLDLEDDDDEKVKKDMMPRMLQLDREDSEDTVSSFMDSNTETAEIDVFTHAAREGGRSPSPVSKIFGSQAREELQDQQPLNSPWCFYIDRNKATGNRADDQADALDPMGHFGTLQEFRQVLNANAEELVAFDDMQDRRNIRMFRKGVAPLKEDPQNLLGGEWLVMIRRSTREQFKPLYLRMLITILSEEFNFAHIINGVVINLRPTYDSISIWTRKRFDMKHLNVTKQHIRDVLGHDEDSLYVKWFTHIQSPRATPTSSPMPSPRGNYSFHGNDLSGNDNSLHVSRTPRGSPNKLSASPLSPDIPAAGGHATNGKCVPPIGVFTSPGSPASYSPSASPRGRLPDSSRRQGQERLGAPGPLGSTGSLHRGQSPLGRAAMTAAAANSGYTTPNVEKPGFQFEGDTFYSPRTRFQTKNQQSSFCQVDNRSESGNWR
eukprot:Clim_evm27s145 gene=Clim_evmTU27s145